MHELPGAPERAERDARDDSGGEDGEIDRRRTGLSIEELAEAADLPIRTIRYYISEGLLPGPGSRGKQATYGEEQLVRLRLIRQLTDRHVPLAKMRDLLTHLSLADVRDLLAEEEHRTAELRQAERSASPREYVSGLLGHARAAREGAPRPTVPSQSAPSYPRSYPSSGAPGGAPGQVQRGRMREAPPQSYPGYPPVRQPGFNKSLYAHESEEPPAPLPAADAWQRWELAPGVELHVRADAERQQRGLIRRLLAIARASRDED